MNFLLALALMAPVSANAVVVSPVANMYSAPTVGADVVSQALCGVIVVLMDEKDQWLRVRTPDNYTGWMPLVSLRRFRPGEAPYASAGEVAVVESISANVYYEPNVTVHQPMLTLPFEARLEVVPAREPAKPNARWLQVRLPDGRAAWIQRGDIDFHPRPLSIKQSIELAKKFLGITYLWAGTSTFGFDCSGFTQMLVRQRGIVMPRDADLQAAWQGVAPVQRRKLRAGDLLFFGPSAENITHTGMFIGHGKFIHDTVHEHPGVQVSNLKDQPWTQLLVACRRLK